MNKSAKWLALIASVALLTSCNNKTEQSTAPTTEASPSPTATETSPSPQAGGAVEFIPVATYEQINVNKDGKVTEADFVGYYVEKAKPPETLSKEDAQNKFKGLDKDNDGNLTKEEATGQK